jgi:hypothetical protein
VYLHLRRASSLSLLYNSTTQAPRHTKAPGLGLSILKSIVDLMRGQIGSHPNPDGKGSIFLFTTIAPWGLSCEPPAFSSSFPLPSGLFVTRSQQEVSQFFTYQTAVEILIMSLYTYNELPHGRWIRLLRLQAAKFDDPISWELITVKLKYAPSYCLATRDTCCLDTRGSLSLDLIVVSRLYSAV